MSKKILDSTPLKFDIQDDEIDNIKFEKILKSNSIIFGKMPAEEKTTLYAYDYKNLNFLYKLLQELVKKDPNPPVGAVTIRFPIKLFKLVVDNQDKWKRWFIKSITRLNNTKFLLKNYYNEEQEKVSYQITQLLAFPKFYSVNDDKINQIQSVTDYDDINKKTKIIQNKVELLEVTFPKEIAMSLWQQRGAGYTHIDFKTINSFIRKHSINFYEAILSKLQLSINEFKTIDHIRLAKEDLSGVFKKDIDTKINFGNYLANIIHLEEEVFPELKEKLPISNYIVDGKAFAIIFELDQEKLQNFISTKLTPYQMEMQKFQNLIESEIHKSQYTSSYADSNSSLYVVKGEGINRGLENFLNVIHEKYCDKELLKTDKEKAKYGNVVMVKNVGFCDKDLMLKPLTPQKRNRVLEYLYKNHYVDIMRDIENCNNEKASDKSIESSSLFAPYIGQVVALSDVEFGVIVEMQNIEDGKIKIELDVFNKNDENREVVSKTERKFDNVMLATEFVLKNKIQKDI